MSVFINKNGLTVGNSSRDLFEEVMRGTGFVMGRNSSLYIENAGLHDKLIVVTRGADSRSPLRTEKFPANQFQKAVDLFTCWCAEG
ncbi:MAG: hypothetical protein QGG38_06100 [Nitrospinaceae bacterium]|nr:hypothetical protein [Nitrospinaceae bacterium]MDP6712244.1 hypothetical protein [Nitrospinaceae bacterium]MDP7058127.1 hypothetical protein [Nitrospinaceae bacterium]HAK37481.1 hypothetical protein [Nitrospina sp.]